MSHLVTSEALNGGYAGMAVAQEPMWDTNPVIPESQHFRSGVFAVIPQSADEVADNGLTANLQ